MKLNSKQAYSILFAFTLTMFCISLILQYGFDLKPCPLCLIARFLVLIIAIIFGIALLHLPGKRGQIAYTLLTFSLALAGIIVTGRHVWIMHLPPALVPSCTPGLDYLLDTLPFFEAMIVVLNGSGECAQTDGVFLGFSLPMWTLISFLMIAMGSLFPLFIKSIKKG